jgi:hypothetical protein
MGRMHSSNQQGCSYSVVVQNLWDVYGITFANDSLLYGALIWETGFESKYPDSQYRVQHHLAFRSQFHDNMMTIPDEEKISECHFFAHVLAIWGTSEVELRNVYINGLLTVLGILNRQYDHGIRRQPLRHLYHFVLFFLRRHMEFETPPHIERDLYFATELLRHTPRIPQSISQLSKPSSTWKSLWSWINDIRYLKAMYILFASNQRRSNDEFDQMSAALRSIRRTIEATLALPEFSAFLQNVTIFQG